MPNSKIQIVGGSFQSANGKPLANGFLQVKLSHDESATVSSAQIAAGTSFAINLDSTGNIPTTPAVFIYVSDVLAPANSYYEVRVFSEDGAEVSAAPQLWQLTTAMLPGPVNVGTIVPYNPPGAGLEIGGTVTLQTNGTNNADQTLLNLKNGNGISITNPSSGNVVFDGPIFKTNSVTNSTQTLLNIVGGSGVTIGESGGSVTISASGGSPFTVAPAWWNSGDGSVYPWTNGANGTFGTGTADQIKFWMIRLPYTFTVSSLAVRINSGVAGSVSGFAIYSATGATKYLAWDNINTANSTTSRTTTLAAPVSLVPNTYICACAASTTSSPTSESGYSTAGTSESSRPWNLGGFIRSGVAANPMVAGVMPSSLGVLSTSTSLGTTIPCVTMNP